MKFELKNIKFAEFASEETLCYQGVLYINDKSTLGIACKNLNHNFIGIEKDPDYCEHVNQLLIKNTEGNERR